MLTLGFFMVQLSDSLLSILAIRGAEIVNSIFGKATSSLHSSQEKR